MACCLDTTKPLSELNLEYCQFKLTDKLKWNLQWNSYIFIEENAVENVVCEMVATLSQPQCVNKVLLEGFIHLNQNYLNQYSLIFHWILWNELYLFFRIQKLSFSDTHLGMLSAKQQPSCFGCSVLIRWNFIDTGTNTISAWLHHGINP